MDKYTAFNLYRSGWTTQGAAVAIPLEPDGERHDVYLASDVDAVFKKYAQHLPDCASLAVDGPCAPYPCSCGLSSLMERSSHA
jgi:hypothetical protein